MSVLATDGSRERALPPSMVERMTLILDAFGSPGARLTLEQVAATTGLPRSTAHRILDQLVRLEWVSHSSGGYALGSRALGLGGQSSGHDDLRAAAAEHLQDLHVKTGLVVHLAVLDGGRVHYLDKIGGRTAGAVPSRVGGRAPAHCTALGKAMLAWLEPEAVEARLHPGLRSWTDDSISDLPRLHRELHRIRERHGLAFERGEFVPGLTCVAAAVHSPDGPVAAVSMVGDRRTPLERVAPLVVDAARRIGQTLHPTTPVWSRTPVR